MTNDVLKGRRILVAEDEYLLADDLREELTTAGAEVVGPFSTLTEAVECVEDGGQIDAAVLDVNLRGVMIFPVADALAARGVPFLFATGYDPWSLPDRFANAPRIGKPLRAQKVAAAIGPLLDEV